MSSGAGNVSTAIPTGGGSQSTGGVVMSSRLRKLLRPVGATGSMDNRRKAQVNHGDTTKTSKISTSATATRTDKKQSDDVDTDSQQDTTKKPGKIDDAMESISGTRIKELDDSLLAYLQNRYKILVRNEITYISRHPREVNIEKAHRMKDISTLGFLSDRHSAYKSLGDPVLDPEELVIDTLFHEESKTARDKLQTSPKGSHHRVNSASGKQRIGSGTGSSSASSSIDGRKARKRVVANVVQSRYKNDRTVGRSLFGTKPPPFDNGYPVIKSRVQQNGARIRSLKLGASYIDSASNNDGHDIRTSDHQIIQEDERGFYNAPVLDYQHFTVDREKRDNYYKTYAADIWAYMQETGSAAMLGKVSKTNHKTQIPTSHAISKKPKEELPHSESAVTTNLPSVAAVNQQSSNVLGLIGKGNKQTSNIPQIYSNKLANKLLNQRDAFYKSRSRMSNSLYRHVGQMEAEQLESFKRKFVSFQTRRYADYEDDLRKMREKARQIKVQEKLKQMADIAWYEDFLRMLPSGISDVKTTARQWNEAKPEEKILIKMKSYIESDTPFNRQTFKSLLKVISKEEFRRENMQKIFRFLKTYAFKLSERDYLSMLEDRGFEETRVVHASVATAAAINALHNNNTNGESRDPGQNTSNNNNNNDVNNNNSNSNISNNNLEVKSDHNMDTDVGNNTFTGTSGNQSGSSQESMEK